jgi:hypothetical protein
VSTKLEQFAGFGVTVLDVEEQPTAPHASVADKTSAIENFMAF